MIDQDLVYRAVRQLDQKSQSGSRPILRETAFISYMLMAFKQGAAKRRQIFKRDRCGLDVRSARIYQGYSPSWYVGH